MSTRTTTAEYRKTHQPTHRPTTLADYQDLARRIAPHGERTTSARRWYDLHQARAAARNTRDPLPIYPNTFARRAEENMRRRWIGVIAGRRWETSITSGYGAWRDAKEIELEIIDRDNRMVLLGLDGWRKYTRQESHHVSLRYLCGSDDNGDWAIRLPGTIGTVQEALNWTTPAEVHKAQAVGKRVLRQGDVWIVESARDNMTALPAGHTWDAASRTLTHDGGHLALAVPFRAKAVQAKVLNYSHTRRQGRFD